MQGLEPVRALDDVAAHTVDCLLVSGAAEGLQHLQSQGRAVLVVLEWCLIQHRQKAVDRDLQVADQASQIDGTLIDVPRPAVVAPQAGQHRFDGGGRVVHRLDHTPAHSALKGAQQGAGMGVEVFFVIHRPAACPAAFPSANHFGRGWF
ncbi:hypothetical protein ACFQY7_11215 [Actinomadura luteofluorescens]|uniref:hypothetical protein n=1 Tax=Actinomadura luteofluorescens TaxID=46163 RepID=UPI003632DECB